MAGETLSLMNFFERVYQEVTKIPVGKVSTYGRIAKVMGTRDARRVGQALHANKSSEIPCHRVVFADGSLASGYAFGGPDVQKQKLILEGILFTGNKANLARYVI